MIVPVIDVALTCQNLKKLCDEKGLSAMKLQNILKLESVQTCYKWFSGKGIPKIDNLLVLARMLDVRLEDILVTVDIEIKD